MKIAGSVMDIERDADEVGAWWKVTIKTKCDIPISTAVTVEWDDTVHRCGASVWKDRFMRRSGGKWYVVAEWNNVMGEFLLSNISVCPDCGEKLT